VFLSVHLSVHTDISETTCQNFTIHVIYYRGSVLFWQSGDTLGTSGFVDDAMFAHGVVRNKRREKGRALEITHQGQQMLLK